MQTNAHDTPLQNFNPGAGRRGGGQAAANEETRLRAEAAESARKALAREEAVANAQATVTAELGSANAAASAAAHVYDGADATRRELLEQV